MLQTESSINSSRNKIMRRQNVEEKALFYWVESTQKPIPVVARSKAWVCGRSLAGIAGSNPVGGFSAFLLWVVCVVRDFCDGSSHFVWDSYRVCLCVCLCVSLSVITWSRVGGKKSTERERERERETAKKKERKNSLNSRVPFRSNELHKNLAEL